MDSEIKQMCQHKITTVMLARELIKAQASTMTIGARASNYMGSGSYSSTPRRTCRPPLGRERTVTSRA
jgi:hypothetical protein